ncbi:hypothetical protein, partial [Loigolactobacillus coryniformis]|uniref:hypothetical protein n=1 Tax=Loigolactobacillus coryniformis TaxID=1610 RepID=UPI00021948BF
MSEEKKRQAVMKVCSLGTTLPEGWLKLVRCHLAAVAQSKLNWITANCQYTVQNSLSCTQKSECAIRRLRAHVLTILFGSVKKELRLH